MSRGLGRTQRAILRALAEHEDGMLTMDLLWDISKLESGWGYSYYTRGTSYRRALRTMQRQGLVAADTYFPNMAGRPKVWTITEAGRALLK